jgi:hypothetical protein
VTLSEAGGENQDSLFHSLSGQHAQREIQLRGKTRRKFTRQSQPEFNGYLCVAK